MSNANELLASLLDEQVQLLQSQIRRLRGEAPPAGTSDKPEKKKRKAKAPVDPNRPKQPLSSYLIFSQQQMSKYRLKDPSKTPSELMQVIGKEWHELSEEKKEVYTTMAQALKADYKKRLEAYNGSAEGKQGAAAPSAAPSSSSKKVTSAPVPIVAPAAIATESVVEDKKKKKRKHEHKEHHHHHHDDQEEEEELAVQTGGEEKKKKKKSKNNNAE